MLMVSLASDSIHASRVRIHFRFASYRSVFDAVRLRMALSLESWPLQALCRQFFATEGAAVVPADSGTLLCGQGKSKCLRLPINSDYAWSGKELTHTSAYCEAWHKISCIEHAVTCQYRVLTEYDIVHFDKWYSEILLRPLISCSVTQCRLVGGNRHFGTTYQTLNISFINSLLCTTTVSSKSYTNVCSEELRHLLMPSLGDQCTIIFLLNPSTE